jgi:ABC-type Fe3+-citrate transport system substrate-binding protein
MKIKKKYDCWFEPTSSYVGTRHCPNLANNYLQIIKNLKKLLIITPFWKHDSVTLRLVAAPYIVAKDFEKNWKTEDLALLKISSTWTYHPLFYHALTRQQF